MLVRESGGRGSDQRMGTVSIPSPCVYRAEEWRGAALLSAGQAGFTLHAQSGFAHSLHSVFRRYHEINENLRQGYVTGVNDTGSKKLRIFP